VNAQQPPYKLRVDVVERLAKAINYRHRSGSTTVGFRGTHLQPGARGEAKVEGKQGYTEIEVEFDDMIPARRYGPQYLTYVMWGITPQGRSQNLGEVVLKGTKSKLDVTTELQAFGMVVTAEPYFAVSQPSDRVVLENYVRPETKGTVEAISAKYELLEPNQFAFDRMPAHLKPERIDDSLPLDLQQARNAIRIAEWLGAGTYAAEALAKTRAKLDSAEDFFVRHADNKLVSMMAREAVQNAEDARLLAKKFAADEDARRIAFERIDLRDQFIQQLSRVFRTNDTGNSLEIVLSDGLFESGNGALRRDTRDKLLRMAGLVLAHPDIRLDIQGSSRRADAVRDFFRNEGVPVYSVPGPSGAVEIIVSGKLLEN